MMILVERKRHHLKIRERVHMRLSRRNVLRDMVLVILVWIAFCRATFGGEASYPVEKRYCVWEVKGTKNTVFFLGSMHFMRKDMYPLPDSINSLLERVRTVVFETDMVQATSEEFRPWMERQMIYAGGKTLKEGIGKEMYDRLVQAAKPLGVDLSSWKNMKPWYVASALPHVKIEKMGYSSKLGLDVTLFGRVQQKQLSVEALDGFKEHMQVYSGMEESLQKEFLEYSLDRLPLLKSSLPELCAAWESGDIDTLVRLRKEGIGSYKGLYQRLFLDKNKRWLPRIELLIEREQDVLVVMGFGHLVGEGSVIQMLRAKGFTVSQR